MMASYHPLSILRITLPQHSWPLCQILTSHNSWTHHLAALGQLMASFHLSCCTTPRNEHGVTEVFHNKLLNLVADGLSPAKLPQGNWPAFSVFEGPNLVFDYMPTLISPNYLWRRHRADSVLHPAKCQATKMFLRCPINILFHRLTNLTSVGLNLSKKANHAVLFLMYLRKQFFADRH